MSAYIAYPYSAATTANGTASGYLTFSKAYGFRKGAYAWLQTSASDTSGMAVLITDVTPTTVKHPSAQSKAP